MPVTRDAFDEGEERYSIESEIVRFLHDNPEKAYNVREITVEVMETGWSEANVESTEFDELVGCVLDLATVSSIMDHLVDNGQVKRRIFDDGRGKRSYYAAP